MAAFALLLRWLDWRGAALCAVVAFVFNVAVLPRVGGRSLFRRDDVARGYPLGILLYPLVVLVLVLLFPRRLEVAAAGWGYLAFGDGFATLCGRLLGGPRLSWNRGKSWAGLAGYLACGSAGAALLYGFVAARPLRGSDLLALVLGALAGALLESLPSELDDNVVPPLAGAFVLSSVLAAAPGAVRLASPETARAFALALLVNAALAGTAALLGVVRPSGAVAGALAGTIVLGAGGPRGYLLLWVFFAGGTLATRFGRRRKEALGKAEEAGGRRGAANVLANVTVPAFCLAVAALLPEAGAAAYRLAATAAFATALMDTLGTEVGQVLRTRTFLLPDLAPVPPGTDGAVSIGGTLAGLAGAAVLSLTAHAVSLVSLPGAGIAVVAALAGTVLESLLGREGAPWKVTNGHVLNFLNTLAGAALALLLSPLA